MAEETNHNQAGEVAPSTVEKQAPDVAEEHAPSTDSPEATDIPTANAPDPEAVNPEVNPNAAKAKKPAAPKGEKPAAKEGAEGKPAAAKAAKEGAEDKPAAAKAAKEGAEGKPAAAKAAKKEKPPALEDKPFVEFVEQYYLPALQKAIAQQGVQDVQLSFAKQKLSIVGFDTSEECWQVMGKLQNGLRQFNLYFLDEDIQGKKGFSCNEGKKPSTLESFLIDERKMTLDLMVYGLVQRLNGQKWLGRN